ncbi:hypothetical protein ACXR2T_12060 [Leucobacter sp. HY1910]
MSPIMAVLLVACLIGYGLALLLLVVWVRAAIARSESRFVSSAALSIATPEPVP